MRSSEVTFLADAIEAGRVRWPTQDVNLRALGIAIDDLDDRQVLANLTDLSASLPLVVWMLRAIARERQTAEKIIAAVEPVASGPRVVSGLRETAEAFREVIDRAQRRIVITGFALHNGRSVLRRLSERMQGSPELEVLLCLDISRQPGDTSDEQSLIGRFAEKFRASEWPGGRFPRLFYDPRSLSSESTARSVLHAKVAAADHSCVLVSSANLTESAFNRNIEIGILCSIRNVTASVVEHIDSLIRVGMLLPVPL